MNCEEYRFLVIDDDPVDGEILRRCLEEIQEWKVELLYFPDLESASSELASGWVHLAFIDYHLGAVTGLDVFRDVLRSGFTQPVIMLTGMGSEEIAVEAMKEGLADYLSKGIINSSNLKRAISNALEKSALQQALEMQKQDLIDAERQRVMMESAGAACHHLDEPLNAMRNSLELIKVHSKNSNPALLGSVENCLTAAGMMAEVLEKFREIREYRTRPYFDQSDILDIGLN